MLENTFVLDASITKLKKKQKLRSQTQKNSIQITQNECYGRKMINSTMIKFVVLLQIFILLNINNVLDELTI